MNLLRGCCAAYRLDIGEYSCSSQWCVGSMDSFAFLFFFSLLFTFLSPIGDLRCIRNVPYPCLLVERRYRNVIFVLSC